MQTGKGIGFRLICLNVGMIHAYMFACLQTYMLTCLHAYLFMIQAQIAYENLMTATKAALNVQAQMEKYTSSHCRMCHWKASGSFELITVS